MYPRLIPLISTDVIVSLVGIKNSFLYQGQNREKEFDVRKNTKLFTDDFLNKVNDKYSKKDKQFSSCLNTRLYYDLVSGRMPSILHNEDANSMAFSIESRVPFLDYRIVEFAIALDGNYKIKNQWSKWIVRKACKEYLPKKVVKRKNKMGFPAPFARWLREGKSKDEIARVIYDFGNRNIVPRETIDKYYKAHMSMETDFNDLLFRFYSMELWLEMCEGVKKV